uniref:Cadherin domain-containing protein n=1 Tax=Timema genevievae TaxID=629358 RepID=A0A7R9JS16_TIMGE|nr:unnamed protein product [Timema genevievae]
MVQSSSHVNVKSARRFFSVDQETGEVSVAEPLQREIAAIVRLTVLVTDTSAPNTQQGTVTVELKDVPATLVAVEQKDVSTTLVAVEQKDVPTTLVAVEQKDVPAKLVAVERKDVPATLVVVERKDVLAT